MVVPSNCHEKTNLLIHKLNVLLHVSSKCILSTRNTNIDITEVLTQVQMQFVHACECVLVFVLHPTSCPERRLSSSTTWWGRVGGGGCEGIHQPVPSLPGSQRLTPCDLITRPLAGTAALLPGPTNQFASSKGKQPHLWEGCPQLHISYVQYMHANVENNVWLWSS